MFAGSRVEPSVISLTRRCSQYFLDAGQTTAFLDNEAVNHFGPGQFFGEVAFISTAGNLMDAMNGENVNPGTMQSRRSASVRAMENCRCLELSVKDFVSIFEGDIVALGNALR